MVVETTYVVVYLDTALLGEIPEMCFFFLSTAWASGLMRRLRFWGMRRFLSWGWARRRILSETCTCDKMYNRKEFHNLIVFSVSKLWIKSKICFLYFFLWNCLRELSYKFWILIICPTIEFSLYITRLLLHEKEDMVCWICCN